MRLYRLNWQLHFGEAPKWAAGVKFILVDPGASPRDAGKAAVVLAGDAGAVAQQLADAAPRVLSPSRFSAWRATVASQVAACTDPRDHVHVLAAGCQKRSHCSVLGLQTFAAHPAMHVSQLTWFPPTAKPVACSSLSKGGTRSMQVPIRWMLPESMQERKVVSWCHHALPR